MSIYNNNGTKIESVIKNDYTNSEINTLNLFLLLNKCIFKGKNNISFCILKKENKRSITIISKKMIKFKQKYNFCILFTYIMFYSNNIKYITFTFFNKNLFVIYVFLSI